MIYLFCEFSDTFSTLDRPEPVNSSSDFSPGQIAGTVIGFIVLFGVFALVLYLIMRPSPGGAGETAVNVPVT